MPVSEDHLATVFLAYLKEAEAGHAPDRQEFLHRYPELASEMASYFSAEQEVDTLFSPMRWIFGTSSTAPLASFGDYEVLGEIAQGGMGIVYRARQKSLNRIVALKVIRNPQLANSTDRQRFRLEAELVANLNHPHIVPVYEVGEKDNLPYFSMKLIEGGSLAQQIAQRRLPDLDPRTRKDAAGRAWSRSELQERQAGIALLLETAALAVHHAHQHLLLHRDLKPGNILLDEAGQPHVTDFGLAKRLHNDNQANETQNIAGTASYMAPEQTKSKTELTVCVDVYGLGAILYELLTGKAPFCGANWLETLTQVREQEPEPPSRARPYVARDLETICLKCLHKDPHKRYASAESLAHDLNRFRDRRPIHGRPTPSWERAWMWIKRKPLVATLYGSLALVLVLAFSTGIWQWRETVRAKDEAETHLYAHRVIQAERDLADGMVDRAEDLLDKCPTELRDWEWNYLKRWCRGDCTVLEGSSGPITDVAIHPNGKTLITGDENGAIRFWSAQDDQQPVLFHQHTNAVSSVSLGSSILAVAYKDMTVKVWDITDKKKPALLKSMEGESNLVAVSPNGKLVAAAGLNNVVRVRDLAAADNAPLDQLQHDAPVICFAFSPDGKLLITAGYGKGKIIKVWDLVSKQERKDIVFRDLDFSVNRVAISPDGNWFAMADGTSIGLWNWPPKPDKETRLHSGSKGRFKSIAFSPDSLKLAATTERGSLTVWEINGKVAFSAGRHKGMIPFVAFTRPADPALVYVRGRELVLERWKPPAGKPVRTLDATRPVAFDVQNARAAIAGPDDRVLLSSLRGDQPPMHLHGAATSLSFLSFSADGKRLAGAAEKGRIYLWDVADGAAPIELRTEQESPNCIALSKDGKLLALAGADNTLKVWDVQKHQEVFAAPLKEPIKSVAFSPDGRRLAAGGESGLLKVWDLHSRNEIAHLKGHVTLILSIAFSPLQNGRFLASGSWDGTVRLWDVQSGKTLRTFEGHSSAIASVHVSPNGKRIASAGMDGVVRLWDTASGQQVLTLQDQETGVTGVAFCGDNGSLLASVSVRGVIKSWDGSALEHASR